MVMSEPLGREERGFIYRPCDAVRRGEGRK